MNQNNFTKKDLQKIKLNEKINKEKIQLNKKTFNYVDDPDSDDILKNVRWAKNIGSMLLLDVKLEMNNDVISHLKFCRIHLAYDARFYKYGCFECFINNEAYWKKLKLKDYFDKKIGRDVCGILEEYVIN